MFLGGWLESQLWSVLTGIVVRFDSLATVRLCWRISSLSRFASCITPTFIRSTSSLPPLSLQRWMNHLKRDPKQRLHTVSIRDVSHGDTTSPSDFLVWPLMQLVLSTLNEINRSGSLKWRAVTERLMTNSLFLPKENHLKCLLGWCESSDPRQSTKPKNTA